MIELSEAACTCGWKGDADAADDHPCTLPDPGSLAEFLLDCLAEDKAAVVAILRQHPHWEADGVDVCDTPDLVLAHVRGGYAAAHIARWDPARVLAECEAKRRIVELSFQDDDWRYGMHAEAMDMVLRLLTVPYADRGGYRQEWTVA